MVRLASVVDFAAHQSVTEAMHTPTTPTAAPVSLELLEAIARQHLRVVTLARQNSDGLDFHDVSVWGIEAALRAAFEAGRTGGAS